MKTHLFPKMKFDIKGHAMERLSKFSTFRPFKAQGQLANQIFQTEFVIAGGGFLSYCNPQLIKLEDDNGFKNNFVIMKREK